MSLQPDLTDAEIVVSGANGDVCAEGTAYKAAVARTSRSSAGDAYLFVETTSVTALITVRQESSMTDAAETTPRRPSALRRWLRRGFLAWTVIAMSWLANSVRTRGVDAAILRSSPTVSVVDHATTLEFLPVSSNGTTALIFLCGSGIAAEAYAPLLRPVAEAGYPIFVIKLPYRFAPMESNKQAAVDRARAVIAAHPETAHWVVSGHSLGGALAARLAQSDAHALSALVLIGTTHPKEHDLSGLRIRVTKVYGSNDGVAPPARILANRRLLPAHATWVEIKGGNHSQFGRYGHQLFDGTATISRDEQESITRSALLAALASTPSS